MLTVFIRSILIYIFLLVIMRLMGKRQLSELQPFEFVITLLIAELVSIPMSDASIPLAYGLIPIFTLYIMHLFINKLSSRSIKFRKLVNGSPMIVITPDGIDTRKLQKLDMNVDDLMDSLRASGHFNPADVEYAILETNGKISVLATAETRNITPSDLGLSVSEATLPKVLISEGRIMDNTINLEQIPTDKISKILNEYHLEPKDVFLMIINGDKDFFIQPYKGKSIRTLILEKQ
ncbi:MAG: DUF421 domain-containing protein [Christensenellales bacterium]|jgi:uncharacterized membrane protein YcaP (DUF421 family)